MAKPRAAWGIDIGNRALKAVKLARSGEGVVIQDVDVIEHENILSNAGDNRDQLIQTALAVFTSKHNNLKGSAAAVGVSGQQSFAKFIPLPPVEEKKIPEIVRFEAMQQIPFPLDEVEWSYQLFRDDASPDVEVGLSFMRKDAVAQHLGYFAGAGLNVQAVQMNPLADYNALAYDGKLAGTTMVIDIGAEAADLVIADGERVWMRSIPIGGNHFTEALVREFKLRFERAEELKRTTATSPHGRRILQAMRPVFADLVSEIQRSIGFYSSTHRESRIAKVMALGGTFKLPGLQKYLQQNLGLDVVKLDAIGQAPPGDARVAAALSEHVLSLVSAYGVALQALGDTKITSSLLPMAIQKERIWKDKVKYFAAAAACFVVGATVPFVVAQNQRAAFESTEAEGARREVDGTLATAKSLDTEWREKENAGADDRKKVVEAKTLTDYRDLWPALYDEINAALPRSKAVTDRATAADDPAGKAGAPKKPAAPAATAAATPPPAGGPAGAAAAAPAVVVGDPQAAAAAVAKFGPRDKRAEVVLEDMEVVYVPQIGELVAKDATGAWLRPDDVFNLRAGRRDLSNLMGIKARYGGVAGPGGAAGRPPTGDAYVNTPPSSPVAGDAAAGGAGAFPARRGFLITLRLTTPNAGNIGFVNKAVVEKLLASEVARQKLWDDYKKRVAEGAAEAPPKITYSIPRVTIASAVPLKLDDVRKQALAKRTQEALARKARSNPNVLAVPGANGNAGSIDVRQLLAVPAPGGGGGIGDAAFNPGFTPPMGDLAGGGGAGGLTPAQQAQLDQYLVDPITGEDVRNDFIVTVLAAVVIEPFVDMPPGSDGGGTPGGGGDSGGGGMPPGLPAAGREGV
jgi:type IV pilus assembly protein PilM